ncbi:MAG: hypothetical protein CMA72_07300 [Euryarchaeota archaeon]|nr:hypothetical protein [Euryarchaeota archaeon]|tara:strand:- start:2276 stop:2491 length:216 start_codon:yes stop_codon:yes gene_type:complete
MSLQPGDLVRYVRAFPGEEHLVYEVESVRHSSDGDRVRLIEEVEDDAEVRPGVMGGFGGWEQAHEFALIVD